MRLIDATSTEFKIKWDYDPEILIAFKKIDWTRRYWQNKPIGAWFVSADMRNLKHLRNFAKEWGFKWTQSAIVLGNEVIRRDKTMEEREDLSSAKTTTFHVDNLKKELFPFQKVAVQYAYDNERVIIADQMGLGKSIEALATIAAKKCRRIVVVCPASLKYNWKNESESWLNCRVVVLNGTKVNNEETKKLFAERDKDDVPLIVIVNYEIVRSWITVLKMMYFDAIIVDEAHRLKSIHAVRTNTLKQMVDGIPIRLLLTGSPLLNRPKELIPLLEILDRLGDFGGLTTFQERYCNGHWTQYGYDIRGKSNLDELHKKLKQSCYIRRLKADVRPDAPSVHHEVIMVDISNRKDYETAERNPVQWFADEKITEQDFVDSISHLSKEDQQILTINRHKATSEIAGRAERLVSVSVLQRLAAKGKLNNIKDWLQNFVDNEEKILVMANHRDVVSKIVEHFHEPHTAQQNYVVLTGETPTNKRQPLVDRFQNDPKCLLFIANMQAGGEGLNLMKASHIAFVEFGWTPGIMDQCIARIDRIGQEKEVNVYYMVGRDTIDEDTIQIIEEKRRTFNEAIDGKFDEDGILERLMRHVVQRNEGRNSRITTTS